MISIARSYAAAPGVSEACELGIAASTPETPFVRSFAEGPLGERPPPFVTGRLEEAGATSHGESVRNGVMDSFPRMFSHRRLPRTEAEATGPSGPFVMRCVVCCAGFCCEFR